MRLHTDYGSAEATGWLEDGPMGECAILSVVSSDQGKGHATIALHRLMEQAVRLGAQRIIVDNMTDDPNRAARGLYRLFQWVDEGHGPEMIHWVSPASLEQITNIADLSRHENKGRYVDAPQDDT